MSSVLIIDDDSALCRSLEIQLGEHGHRVRWATDGASGLAALSKETPDLLLLDLGLPDQSGIEVLHKLRQTHPDLPVAMITGQQDMKATIEAMRSGAFDYVRKPFDMDDMILMIEKAIRFRTVHREKPQKIAVKVVSDEPDEIVGADKKIVAVVKQIGLLSRSRIPVLIEGESGTGKELVARALHESSTPNEPFVAINCSAVVPTLLVSELFGHEKGAFTGAAARKIGKFEHAGQGTVFLDEIGDMALDLQAKLLRVLEQQEFERVGGLQKIPFNARVIAATNRHLETCVGKGEFRQDLFYRLAVSRLVLPPLRERLGDIPLLVNHLITRAARKLHRHVAGIEEQAMRYLETCDWPGNVRELQNVLTRAVALARGPVITTDDLEFTFAKEPAPQIEEIASLEEAERRHIRKALLSTGWNITHTARILRLSPTTLRKKIADLGLRKPQ